MKGESPVCHQQSSMYGTSSVSRAPREWSTNLGGKLYLRLNISSRPIANKYREGKMKRTLKRELKVPELAEGEANGICVVWQDCCMLWYCAAAHLLLCCDAVPLCVMWLATRACANPCMKSQLGILIVGCG